MGQIIGTRTAWTEYDYNDEELYTIGIEAELLSQDVTKNTSTLRLHTYITAHQRFYLIPNIDKDSQCNGTYFHNYEYTINGGTTVYSPYGWNVDEFAVDDGSSLYFSRGTHYFGYSSSSKEVVVTHLDDGTAYITLKSWHFGDTSSKRPLYYLSGDSEEDAERTDTSYGSHRIDIPKIIPKAVINTATAFTDEENPIITYTCPNPSKVTSLQACIADSTGTTIYVPYRDISTTGTSYTFTLTDEERNALRAAAANSKTMNVRFYVKSVVFGETFLESLERVFTVTNCNPTITDIVIVDANSTTAALTGNTETLVRYESMAEYSFTPEAKKSATIINNYVVNGSQKVVGLAQGIIDDIETGIFTFGTTDSRGLTTEVTVEKETVPYVKPTCYQDIFMSMSGELSAVAEVTISGNYYDGSFGAVDNTIKIELRHTQNDGTMGDWVDLTDGLIPVFNGDTYSLDITISGFDYSQAYTFQSRITDKLNTVISAEYVVRLMPVFDWGEKDFNFNVPVNINADNLDMNGETVLRHTGAATNNTVLSGSGGHIYLRPGGTTDTSSEARLTAQGDLELKGDLIVNGVNIIAALQEAGII